MPVRLEDVQGAEPHMRTVPVRCQENLLAQQPSAGPLVSVKWPEVSEVADPSDINSSITSLYRPEYCSRAGKYLTTEMRGGRILSIFDEYMRPHPF